MRSALRVGLSCAAVALLLAALPLPLLLGYLPPPWAAPLIRPLLLGVPTALIFGPLALLLGGLAGFLAGRHALRAPAVEPAAARAAAVRQGLAAGGVAGGGVLLGVALFFGVLLASLASTPDLREQMAQLIARQFQSTGGDSGLALRLFDGAFLLAGLCSGVVNLALALAVGAFAGWLATLGRRPRQGDEVPR
jgi:hypothetical protein